MKPHKFKKLINNHFTRLKGLPSGLRKTLGLSLIILGIFGFLPIIGFWMVPLGLMLLAIDFRWARRLLTRLKYQWQKIQKKHKNRSP